MVIYLIMNKNNNCLDILNTLGSITPYYQDGILSKVDIVTNLDKASIIEFYNRSSILRKYTYKITANDTDIYFYELNNRIKDFVGLKKSIEDDNNDRKEYISYKANLVESDYLGHMLKIKNNEIAKASSVDSLVLRNEIEGIKKRKLIIDCLIKLYEKVSTRR